LTKIVLAFFSSVSDSGRKAEKKRPIERQTLFFRRREEGAARDEDREDAARVDRFTAAITITT